jgi:hypothetical protein
VIGFMLMFAVLNMDFPPQKNKAECKSVHTAITTLLSFPISVG